MTAQVTGPLAEDLDAKVPEILGRYPKSRSRSAVLPLLHLVQQRDGFLTTGGIDQVAGVLSLTPAEVTAVATFYTMLHLKPKGRHVVSVCHNIACTLLGAEEIISALQIELEIECGETSADGEFTLERAECLARCDLAPMLQIDYDEMIGPLTPDSAIDVISSYQGQEPKSPREEVEAGEPLLIDSIEITAEEKRWLDRGQGR